MSKKIRFSHPVLQVGPVPRGTEQFMEPAGKACDTATTSGKKRCPVQMIFLHGKAYLRLCVEAEKPGRLVPIKNPRDAIAKAHKLCADFWRGPGRGWENDVEHYPLGETQEDIAKTARRLGRRR